MIINTSSVKTEALLLFCRDIIDNYKLSDENLFNIGEDLKKFVGLNIDDLEHAINVIIQKNDYYIRNRKIHRIKIILKYYNFLNKTISQYFQNDTSFNPSMICFSLLATWFKELEHQKESKEFIYFTIYPYGEIFDNLIVNIKDDKYKKLNIKMIQIAEDVLIKFNNKGIDGI